MKRHDGTVVADSYERYEQMQRERELEARVQSLEAEVQAIKQLLLDKYA